MCCFHRYCLWTLKAKYKEDFTTPGIAYFEIKNHGNFSSVTEISNIHF